MCFVSGCSINNIHWNVRISNSGLFAIKEWSSSRTCIVLQVESLNAFQTTFQQCNVYYRKCKPHSHCGSVNIKVPMLFSCLSLSVNSLLHGSAGLPLIHRAAHTHTLIRHVVGRRRPTLELLSLGIFHQDRWDINTENVQEFLVCLWKYFLLFY